MMAPRYAAMPPNLKKRRANILQAPWILDQTTCSSVGFLFDGVALDNCRYWQTAGEREGENPMKTPLPYIIIFGMSTPFVILAIAFANGWIKVPVR